MFFSEISRFHPQKTDWMYYPISKFQSALSFGLDWATFPHPGVPWTHNVGFSPQPTVDVNRVSTRTCVTIRWCSRNSDSPWGWHCTRIPGDPTIPPLLSETVATSCGCYNSGQSAGWNEQYLRNVPSRHNCKARRPLPQRLEFFRCAHS